ncbi:MAG TPA: hypothetical protein PLA87_12620, partial [Pseudomonadota bacterium]|nr:hypothetical protein [Pseudomonadota bacterium]
MAIVRVCPQCKAQFKGGEPFCPYDATALVSESPAPAAAEEDPLLGKLLADRYQLRQVLGRGGMGVVYLADHRMLDRQFAVKVLPAWAGNDPTARARFEREAKASTRVSHPHIVRVYDYGQTESGL